MSEDDVCPRILLTFAIFLSHRRGGGFVHFDVKIADPSQRQCQQIRYNIDGDSSIKENLENCRAFLDEHDHLAVLGSCPAHAALCICLAADTPAPRTSYVANTDKSTQSVCFSSPAVYPQSDADSQTDTKVLQHIYQQLVMCDTQNRISCIELVDLKDRSFHRLTSMPLPRPRADDFVSLFRQVVKQHGEDSAIDSWDKRLTYSELDAASTAAAAALRSLGVKHGDTVILALSWSSWAPVCALATFKASAAFCFVDPSEPKARVDWFLEQVKGRLVLCDAGCHDRLSASAAQVASVQSLCLDRPASSLKDQHQEARAGDVAYVLFTSGSTGKPKTVLTSQQALAAGAEHQARALGICQGSRVLGDGPLTFAGVMPKLLFAFAVAACLCIPQRSQDIFEAVACLRTDFLLLPVGAACKIDPTKFKTRQTVCLGAEVLPASIATLWGRQHSLRIAYGASEANGVISAKTWERAISSREVGTTGAHRFWIVDPADHRRLVPLGWPGEVLIQSVALAFAYLGDEAATARAFPCAPAWYPDVAKAQPATTSTFGEPCDLPVRWYKTGDMGRLDPATLSLEVLGRIDQLQLMLPGGRIDVTMLEAKAEAAAGRPLGIAVQLGVPRGDTVPRVFAFLASDSDEGKLPHVRVLGSGVVQDAALQRALLDAWTLDASGRPEYVVVVEGLPRLHSGKVWRHLLRDWIGERSLRQLEKWRLSEEDVR